MQKDSQAKIHEIPLLSFFTGAGLLDIGFIEVGFPVVWHNECDPEFITGFEYAMESLYGETQDNEAKKVQNRLPIQEVGANAIEREAFGNEGKPSIFGIIGGPPCPDFSSGGQHRGKDGTNGYLSQIFVDRILSLLPTFFLFENVPGLLKTSKHKAYLTHLLNQLQTKYAVDINILNALDFGVPQDRDRVFLLGFKRDWLQRERGLQFSETAGGWDLILETVKKKLSRSPSVQAQQYTLPLTGDYQWFPWPRDDRFFGAKIAYDWPTTSPFGADVEKPKDIPEELMVGTYICDGERLSALPNGNEGFRAYSPKFTTIAEGDVRGKSFKRLHRWRYSPLAAYGNNEVHLHPTQPRRLTVREAMLIQSVPDKYALPEKMSLSKKFKTISNGVPVRLAKALAEQVAATLLEDKPFEHGDQ